MSFGALFKVHPVAKAAAIGGCVLGVAAGAYGTWRVRDRRLGTWDSQWREFQAAQRYATDDAHFDTGVFHSELCPEWDPGYPSRAAREHLHALFEGAKDLPRISHSQQLRSIRVFLPLCGASRDLAAIDEHLQAEVHAFGHSKGGQPANYRPTVLGVERSEAALQYLLDRDYGSAFERKEFDTFSKTYMYFLNQRIKFVLCDMFNEVIPRLVLQAQGVFDRWALSSIEPNDRKKYAEMMQLILSKKGRILLTVYNYDSGKREAAYKQRAKELNALVKGQPLGDEATAESRQQLEHLKLELSRCLNGPKYPYAIGPNDVDAIYKKVTKGDANKVKLLQSVRLKQSDDAFERSLIDRFHLDEDATLDIYLIENNAAKKYDPL